MRTGVLFILGAAVLWGTTGTAQQLGPIDADPLAVGTVRLWVGAIGLVIASAVMTGKVGFRGVRPLPLLATGVGVAAYQLTFFGGVARAGVALGTIVAIGSSPVFAGAIAAVWDGERPGRPWYVATVISVMGVVLIAGDSIGTVDVLGIVLALGAGASYALFTNGSKHMVATHRPVTAMAAGFTLGAVLVSPLLWLRPPAYLSSASGRVMALWLGLGTVTVAYALFAYGVRHVPVSTAATLTLGEPVVATTLGVLVLAERPGVGAWVGVLLVMVGLAILALAPRFDRAAVI